MIPFLRTHPKPPFLKIQLCDKVRRNLQVIEQNGGFHCAQLQERELGCADQRTTSERAAGSPAAFLTVGGLTPTEKKQSSSSHPEKTIVQTAHNQNWTRCDNNDGDGDLSPPVFKNLYRTRLQPRWGGAASCKRRPLAPASPLLIIAFRLVLIEMLFE